jgi:hypothetical protein
MPAGPLSDFFEFFFFAIVLLAVTISLGFLTEGLVGSDFKSVNLKIAAALPLTQIGQDS